MKKTLFSLVSLLILSGCVGGIMGDSRTKLHIKMFTTGTSAPMAIHLFALESIDHFKKLDYFELMKKRHSKLQGDILAQTKKTLMPGQVSTIHMEADRNARYFAVVAGFSNVNTNDNWRAIRSIRSGKSNNFTVTITSSRIIIR